MDLLFFRLHLLFFISTCMYMFMRTRTRPNLPWFSNSPKKGGGACPCAPRGRFILSSLFLELVARVFFRPILCLFIAWSHRPHSRRLPLCLSPHPLRKAAGWVVGGRRQRNNQTPLAGNTPAWWHSFFLFPTYKRRANDTKRVLKSKHGSKVGQVYKTQPTRGFESTEYMYHVQKGQRSKCSCLKKSAAFRAGHVYFIYFLQFSFFFLGKKGNGIFCLLSTWIHFHATQKSK